MWSEGRHTIPKATSKSHIPQKSAVCAGTHLRVVCSIHNFGLHQKKPKAPGNSIQCRHRRLEGIEEGQKELEPRGVKFFMQMQPHAVWVNLYPHDLLGVHTILVGDI